MKNLLMVNKVLMATLMLSASANVFAIQKCQDSEGKWHYGDNADQYCTETKVTTLNDRGFVKETLEAPKTAEELAAEELALQEEAKAAEQKRKEQEERDRILSIYEQESDIDRQRDNQLASVDGNIRVHQAYLKQMDAKVLRLEGKSTKAKGKRKEDIDAELLASKERIKEFSAELERLQAQKLNIAEKFAREKKLYREFTEG